MAMGGQPFFSRESKLLHLVIKQIGLPLRGRPILLITCMITDRIGLHSVLLPLLISLSGIGRRAQGNKST